MHKSVYITVNSLKDACIELNWDSTPRENGIRPEYIALYNCDIRKTSVVSTHPLKDVALLFMSQDRWILLHTIPLTDHMVAVLI